jgi:ABC-type amino acid transport substrate-binding protein
MFKKLFLTVALLSLTASAHAEDVFDRVMKTRAINCGYIIAPPYITKDANTGALGGMNYEMMEAIGKNLGLKINWAIEVGPGDVAAALSANKIDVMCQTIWPSAGRYTGMTFVDKPEFYSAIYAIVHADDTRFDGDLSKANNKDIKAAGIEGDFSYDIIKEKLPNAQALSLAGSISVAEFIMHLTTKKADILFFDKGTLTDFSKTNPNQIKVVENVPAARIFGEHLAVKLGEYKMRDILNMATLQLVNDGVFDEIVARYAKEYNTEIYPPAKDFAKQ